MAGCTDTLDPGHFRPRTVPTQDTSAPVPNCPQDTSALVPNVWKVRSVLGPKCPGSEVSVHHIKYLGVYLVSRSDIKFDINPVKRCFYAVCNHFHIVVDWTK